MRWHEIQQARVHSPPSRGRLFFSKAEVLIMVFYILSAFLFCECVHMSVCVFLCVWVSGVRGLF